MFQMLLSTYSIYLFQPNTGAMVHPTENNQTRRILSIALLFVNGLALKPLTMTLYLSKAIMVMVHIDAQPNKDPNIPYISHISGPNGVKYSKTPSSKARGSF